MQSPDIRGLALPVHGSRVQVEGTRRSLTATPASDQAEIDDDDLEVPASSEQQDVQEDQDEAELLDAALGVHPRRNWGGMGWRDGCLGNFERAARGLLDAHGVSHPRGVSANNFPQAVSGSTQSTCSPSRIRSQSTHACCRLTHCGRVGQGGREERGAPGGQGRGPHGFQGLRGSESTSAKRQLATRKVGLGHSGGLSPPTRARRRLAPPAFPPAPLPIGAHGRSLSPRPSPPTLLCPLGHIC